uniref:Transposase-associated domain-containing protein n=1 Tax=Chenopodium quinoa TaxID=63459 RepID=A0A803N889_CHEQI
MEGGTNNWWMFAKWSDEYEQGVDEYVKRAFAIKSQGNQICCSCQICHYHFLPCEGVVRDHLICNGFVPRLDKLSKLGFNTQREETILDNDEWSIPNDSRDDVVRLFHDAHDAFRQGPNDEAKFFLRLVEEWQEELYPGSKNHSKLSFMIRLLILKCDHNLTNAAFGDILELIRESTKGYLACSEFHYELDYEWLPYSGKNVYRENCKFLPPFHPWRRDKRNFDGKVEERHQPTPLNGIDVANLLRGFPNEFGKKQKKPRRVVDDPNPWKKRTKDHVSAHRDLVELNLMPELQPRELEDGGEEFPRSCFWISLEQKRKFCQVFKNAKLLQGYASNIGRCMKGSKAKAFDSQSQLPN